LRSIAALVACWGVLACGPNKVYSVWLVPSGAQYDSLRSLVCGLAARYPSHCFMPHVTVVGDVQGTLDDITHRAEKLAQRTGLLDARLTSIGWTPGNYFRSFYVLIDETAGFSKLYVDTCAVIGKCQTRPYHMSIMYTDTLSDSARAAIRDSLYAGRGSRTFGSTVRLTRLLVCSTSGLPPEKWTCPKEIKLE
jgi:hypothetical protein